jgi:hypothetical protein
LNRLEEAEDCFESVMKFKVDFDVTAWVQVAFYHSAIKNKDGLINSLKRVIENGPEFKEVLKHPVFNEYRDDPDYIELTK